MKSSECLTAEAMAEMSSQLKQIREEIGRIAERLVERPGGTLPRVLTKDQAAKQLSISVRKLRGLIRDGLVVTVPIGRRNLIPLSEVERMADPAPVGQKQPVDSIVVRSNGAPRKKTPRAAAQAEVEKMRAAHAAERRKR